MKTIKFREFKTSSKKIVLGGKSAENNEELIKQVQGEEIVLHTAKPGSPFVNIKSEKENKKSTKKEIKESAIFCAKYSQDWKKNHGDVKVHIFRGKDIFKNKDMKPGTFGVKKFKEINVKKKDILNFEEKHG